MQKIPQINPGHYCNVKFAAANKAEAILRRFANCFTAALGHLKLGCDVRLL